MLLMPARVPRKIAIDLLLFSLSPVEEVRDHRNLSAELTVVQRLIPKSRKILLSGPSEEKRPAELRTGPPPLQLHRRSYKVSGCRSAFGLLL